MVFAVKNEFKGGVTAVLTEKCWDAELAELDERMGKKVNDALRNAQKKGELKDLKGGGLRTARTALQKKLTKENFTEEELTILATGKSNKGFHYLGSSKVMSQIGKAFAEAMAEFATKSLTK